MENQFSEKSAEIVFISELDDSQVGWEYPIGWEYPNGFLPGLKIGENSDSTLNQEPS